MYSYRRYQHLKFTLLLQPSTEPRRQGGTRLRLQLRWVGGHDHDDEERQRQQRRGRRWVGGAPTTRGSAFGRGRWEDLQGNRARGFEINLWALGDLLVETGGLQPPNDHHSLVVGDGLADGNIKSREVY
ncbi:hypothetical protein N7539_001968 [Penicillium diatomitis]|uniref:Uncharacterized protein n=1 Tax=Penicillium diatomitis TaxID=2819901 RepID=A0A9X0C056_9EURO|nr:uncharacterized protein N7539_001968 [Penicillium diatomitis]KAJ5493222.1 hypothetical protein N7539_001968 [Penicillium diatomitis]